MRNRLKLLIVDDEKYIRSLLKYCIDWQMLGIEICGECTCAEEGLQLVEELQPNIIFSDICMDFMDGIEFSRKVKEAYPYIKIVLLTGHSDFDYASRGIDAGVSAYLLKPIDEDKILNVIQKLKEDIFHEQDKEDELQKLKEYLTDSRSFLIQNNLNALMLPSADIENIIRRLQFLSVDFANPYFQVAIVSLSSEDIPGNKNSENPYLLSMECSRILSKELNGFENVYLIFDYNHTNVILSNDPSLSLSSTLEQAKIVLLEQLPCSVTIGIGNSVSTLSQIRISYQNAAEAVKYRTVSGKNQVILYDYIKTEKQSSSFHLEDAIASILEAVKSEDQSASLTLVNNCITNQITEDYTDIIPIRVTVSTIINHLSDMLIQSGLRNTDAFRYSLAAYERLFRMETVAELENMVHNLIRAIIETFSSIRTEKNTNTIHAILRYMEQNFENPDLSLSSVADKFYLNASYLSRLFKLETDTTFTKYLTELRLKRAAELLLNTPLRSYEISEKVGFRDPKYFSSCFKKHYNMASNSYRINAGQEKS